MIRPVLASCVLLLAPALLAAETLPDPKLTDGIKSFVQFHCSECHGDQAREGGLDLLVLEWQPAQRPNFDRWVKVYERVSKGEMPPPTEPAPEVKRREKFLDELGRRLEAANIRQQSEQGRTVLRRLNRVEYENTLHDLLAIDTPLAQILPEDTPADGFDTVAEGLRISQLQIEKYLEAADVAIDAALQLGPAPTVLKKRYTYKEEQGIRQNLDTPEGTVRDPVSKAKHQIIFRELPDAVVFFSDGYSPTDLRQLQIRDPGRYRFRISAYGYKSRGKPVMLCLYADRGVAERRLLAYADMPPDRPREVEMIVRLMPNERIKVVPYGTGYDDEGRGVWQVGGPRYEGIGLAVQWVEVEGPLVESWPPPSVRNLFAGVPVQELARNKRKYERGKQIAYALAPADPQRDARTVVERFATRAFRRPLESGEADRFVKLATDELAAGRSFEDALRVAFRALLTAPQFLLFTEQPGKLDDYALASRLSYFLWSTLPDDELLLLAAGRRLSEPEVLKKQIERMLTNPNSQALVTNFVGQWLDLRRIDATSPDSRLYPEYDDMLKLAMIGETEAFFRELLVKDLNVSNFIQSDFAMLNRRIAEHYEIPGVVGEQFQRVKLPEGSPRGGVLTQASVLKVTANGTVTSPVLRGAWVMKRLLGEPPPPPPPVPSIEPDTRGATTIRDQLAKHRTSETCNSCHQSIDPPGFALESFDVIGGWRERYRSVELGDRPTTKLRGRNVWQYKLGPAVDPSGALADGRSFADIVEFKKLLLDRQEQVLRSVTENLLIYATGAGIDFADRKCVDQIMTEVAAAGGGLRTLVHQIVLSRVFQSK